MSGVAATNYGCDCGYECGTGGSECRCNIIQFILIPYCCGDGDGFGHSDCGGGCSCRCSCGDGYGDMIWLILILCYCGDGGGGLRC